MPSKPEGIARLFLVKDVVRVRILPGQLGFEIGPYFLDPPCRDRPAGKIAISVAEEGRTRRSNTYGTRILRRLYLVSR